MIKIEDVVLPSAEQVMAVIKGMRNPMNSWAKIDSELLYDEDLNPVDILIGEADLGLASGLAQGGSVNAKYRRQLPVWLTITAPLYWWKEFDTYKIGTTSNSTSTMHKIHDHKFTDDDFSVDQLMGSNDYETLDDAGYNIDFKECMHFSRIGLNYARERFLAIKHRLSTDKSLSQAERQHLSRMAKRFWYQMIQLLPSNYNYIRTVTLNYEVLHNIYIWRKNHKLDEWREFCKWIETLPHSELITKRETITTMEAKNVLKMLNEGNTADAIAMLEDMVK